MKKLLSFLFPHYRFISKCREIEADIEFMGWDSYDALGYWIFELSIEEKRNPDKEFSDLLELLKTARLFGIDKAEGYSQEMVDLAAEIYNTAFRVYGTENKKRKIP